MCLSRGRRGALEEHGGASGVFITTSSFTPQALDFADRMGNRMVVVDGAKLSALMLKYRVGVEVRETYELLELDEDCFEDA